MLSMEALLSFLLLLLIISSVFTTIKETALKSEEIREVKRGEEALREEALFRHLWNVYGGFEGGESRGEVKVSAWKASIKFGEKVLEKEGVYKYDGREME